MSKEATSASRRMYLRGFAYWCVSKEATGEEKEAQEGMWRGSGVARKGENRRHSSLVA